MKQNNLKVMPLQNDIIKYHVKDLVIMLISIVKMIILFVITDIRLKF